jgi:hypothetical protein
MLRHLATVLMPHLKQIKLASAALALLLIASLSWAQFAGHGANVAKPHCNMSGHTSGHMSGHSARHTNARPALKQHDCCPHAARQKGKTVCCQQPCHVVFAQMPMLGADAALFVPNYPSALPKLRYRARWAAMANTPELRPPII